MEVPLIDLSKQYKGIKKNIDQAIRRILNSGEFILGEEVKKLEEEIASFSRVKFAIGVASGTDALHLALRSLEIKPEDEVITTPFTFVATAEVITYLGARPVFVDIDPKSYNLDPQRIEEKITSRTKVILPVHLYGQPARMNEIIRLAKKYNLRIIEDAAQSIGALYKNKSVGSFGDAGILSFFPSKNLGCFGDGGMVLTNDPEIAKKVRTLRVHGQTEKYSHRIIGYSSRLDALQSAILRVKLKKINSWNKKRRKIAQLYREGLKNISSIILPEEEKFSYHVYHQFTIRCKKRDQLRKWLKPKGISTAIHYPSPLYLQEAFKFLNYKKGTFPESEKAALEVLSLPIYPELNEKQIQKVIKEIKRFFGDKNC